MAKVHVGTSGWNYPSWPGVFYPEKLPGRAWLAFYAREFSTVEVNYSFYRLPDPKAFARWVEQVPQDFTFSVKASRFISHIKRLQGVAKAWRAFVSRAMALKAQLGPVLVQLPPHFPKDTARLDRFLKQAAPSVPRLVFEFRNDSWLTEEVYDLLRRHNTALCVADSVRYRRVDVITADFTYIRFHGRSKMFASHYTKAELAKEARKIRRHVDNGLDVYVYFNNDAKGYAVKNARTLIGLLGESEKAGWKAASGLLAK
jgi:uncharacterized protein YecE (DUF72 family)